MILLGESDVGRVRPDVSRTRPRSTVPLIAVNELQKSYGDVRALDGVTFEVHDGDVLGILGPNGAGKTTLIEILEGLRSADGGEAAILGRDVKDGLGAMRVRVGIAMQKTALPMNLRVSELLRLYAVLYARPDGIDELLERLGLCEKQHAVAATLSGGQLQRLSLALALLPRPDVLFLDEPTSDLDPQGRRAVWELLRDPAWAPRCILITTHQMDEAEQLCNRVAIIDHGRILSIGRPADLISRHAPLRTVRFSVPGHVLLRDYDAHYEPIPGSLARMVRIQTDNVERDLRHLLDLQSTLGFTIEDLFVEHATLEDVFLALTGKTIRD